MEEEFKFLKEKCFARGEYKGLTLESFLELQENEVITVCEQIGNLRNRAKLRDMWDETHKSKSIFYYHHGVCYCK
jgi:hypothetical protein